MTLASKLAAVEDAVQTLLDARAANVGSPLHVATGRGMSGQVPVDLGQPTPVQPEHVWTAPDANADRTPLTTGSLGGTFEEEFTVLVRVFVAVGGDDNATFKVARDRGVVLMNDVEATWAGQAVPTASGILDAWVSGIERDTGIFGDSTGVVHTLSLRCSAYLGPA